MRIFSYLYDKMLSWARHRHAPYYLAGVSFAESSFFPLMPDIMLAPMSIATPDKAFRYAGITTVTSVLGGVFGYILGAFLFSWLHPYLTQWGYEPLIQTVIAWFHYWGFWAMFMAGITPIPYKVFTICAGALSLPLLPFILASLIGRGARFFLVAAIMYWGGERMEQKLRSVIDKLGWLIIGIILIAYVAWRIYK